MQYEISQGPLDQYMNNPPRRYPSSKQGRMPPYLVSKKKRSKSDVRKWNEYVSIRTSYLRRNSYVATVLVGTVAIPAWSVLRPRAAAAAGIHVVARYYLP